MTTQGASMNPIYDSSTLGTTTLKTVTDVPQAPSGGFSWYYLIGPLIGLIASVAIVIALCKCLSEIWQHEMEYRRGGENQVQGERDRDRRNNIDTRRYSSSRINDLDLENNIILETNSERNRRERRLKIEAEEKLPTYSEIVEDGRKRGRHVHETDNHAFAPDSVRQMQETSIGIRAPGQEKKLSYDGGSLSSASDVLSPPSYESSTSDKI